MTISACWEVEPLGSPNKLPIKCDILSTLTALSKESCPTSLLLPECSKKSTTKNNLVQVTLLPAGILTKALKSTQWIWEGLPLKGTLPWEGLAVGSFTDTAMHTTSLTWHLRRPKTSAFRLCLWPWRETAAQEVSSDWPTLLRKEWKSSTTHMKVFLTNRFDWCIVWCDLFFLLNNGNL